MPGASLPVTADNTIPPLSPLLQGVLRCLQAFDPLHTRWTTPSGDSRGTNRLRQGQNQLSPVLNVPNRPLIPLLGKLLVDDVRVDHHHFQEPEEDLAPPLDELVEEAVIADKLVHLVDAKHILVMAFGFFVAVLVGLKSYARLVSMCTLSCVHVNM